MKDIFRMMVTMMALGLSSALLAEIYPQSAWMIGWIAGTLSVAINAAIVIKDLK